MQDSKQALAFDVVGDLDGAADSSKAVRFNGGIEERATAEGDEILPPKNKRMLESILDVILRPDGANHDQKRIAVK